MTRRSTPRRRTSSGTSGILPIHITFPETGFEQAEAFTLRCYIEDRPVFLGAHNNPWLFSSPDPMLDVIEDDDQNDIEKPGHDLRDLATWPTVVGAVRHDDMPLAIAEEDDVDLQAADAMVRGDVAFDASIFASAADLLLDLSEYADLDGSKDLLEGEGALSDVVAAAREGDDVEADDLTDEVVEQWESVLGEIASTIEWAD